MAGWLWPSFSLKTSDKRSMNFIFIFLFHFIVVVVAYIENNFFKKSCRAFFLNKFVQINMYTYVCIRGLFLLLLNYYNNKFIYYYYCYFFGECLFKFLESRRVWNVREISVERNFSFIFIWIFVFFLCFCDKFTKYLFK